MDMSEELINHLHESLEYAKNNPKTLRDTIEAGLLDLLKDEAEREGTKLDVLMGHEDTVKIVDYITESMKNHLHKVNGHENRYRFSPHLMGMSMNLYLQAGPSAYNQMRRDNVVVVSSSNYLAKTRQLQKITVGDCVVMYEKQLLKRDTPEEVGELMCDEMKLQENILINVSSNRMVGFTEDFTCQKKILKNLLDEDNIDSFCKPATYVNQWRYRSVNGRSFNCEFWFNAGSLDGSALLEQFVQVVLRCEIAGSRVMGFVCVAGGNNARLMKLLRGNKPLPEGAWLPLDCVRTRNPFDPTRFIFLFHCVTHNLKPVRNALYTSWVLNGKRQFLDVNNVKIGKGIVEECFERDRQRELRCHAPISEICESTIILNKWSKMNVSEAKRVFSWKTLSEMAVSIYNELGVSKEEQVSKENHGPFTDLGYMPAVARHLQSVLKEKSLPNHEEIAPKVSLFEWLANMHEIFNQCLMNMERRVAWHNIDRYENQVKKCLEYFQSLRKRQLQRRKAGDDDWKLSFLASETWQNLRITCCGFFAYCRGVIGYTDYVPQGTIPKFTCVSPAHANSSSLEAWFSVARAYKLDNSGAYASLVAAKDMQNSSEATIALDRGQMYSSVDVGAVSAGKVIGPSELIKFHNEREKRVCDLIYGYDVAKTYQCDEPTPAYSPAVTAMIHSKLKKYEKDALLHLKTKSLENGYLHELLHQDHFRQWMRLSLDTPSQFWFESLLEDTLEASMVQQFDEACQVILDRMFEMTVESLKMRDDDQHSFEFHLHEFHQSAEFALLYWKHLPGRLADYHQGCVMMYLSLSRLHSQWVKDAITVARRTRHPELFTKKSNQSLSVVEQNGEVNRFLGWAIFSSMKKYSDESAHDKSCKQILASMMMYKREMDDEYMSKYYDANMTMLNRGGLTLVNSIFFDWGRQLLSMVRAVFDIDTINQDPQNAFQTAKQLVMDNESLRLQYLHLCQLQSLGSNESCSEVYYTFVRKTIHARFAVVFRHWKEANVKKHGQVAFRTKLKAQYGKSTKEGKAEPNAKKKPPTKKSTKTKSKKTTSVQSDFPLSPDDAAKNRKKRKEYLKQQRDSRKRMRIQCAAM